MAFRTNPNSDYDPTRYNKPKSLRQRIPATQVKDFHDTDDLDSSPEAHHHTLGYKAGQAAPGDKVDARLKAVEAGGGSGGGGGAALTVTDGDVSVDSVDTITFDGATATDDGDGNVTITIVGGGSAYKVLSDTTDTYSYLGKNVPSAETSDSGWEVTRVTFATFDTPVVVETAIGIWDDRESLTYG